MTVTHTTRPASADEIAAEMDRRGAVIEQLEAQIARLEKNLEGAAKVAFFEGANSGMAAAHEADQAAAGGKLDVVTIQKIADLDARWDRSLAKAALRFAIADAKAVRS